MDDEQDNDSDSSRLRMTFRIAVVGVAAVLLALLIALIFLHGVRKPGQVIPAVLGSATAAIGTLVGLVAGHSAGAAGKVQAERRATDNEQDAAAGRALAKSMLIDEPAGAQLKALGAAGAQAGSDASELARRHADLARSLFPGVDQ